MKKINVAIPSWTVLFYYPIALMGIMGVGFCLMALSDLFTSYWAKIPLLTVGGLLNLIGLIAALYMLYVLGKSIVEDMKGKEDGKTS